MSLTGWLWGSSQVDEAVDKATSELLPAGTEDIALNLEISDQIRSKSVQPKDAMRALKRRLNHKNPNVQLLALNLTDTCVKNGGDHFLVEVASREFMDNLVSILKIPVLNLDVKNRILRYIQNWAVAFEGKINLSYVDHTYKTLKMEGFTFPPRDLAISSSAMVDTQTAPEWIDSDVCLRCRTAFTFTNRKHHCRNCGQVFDQQCSSKLLPLPHYGIQDSVRVCDGCYAKLTKVKGGKDDRKHHRSQSTRHRSGRELADEELQRAIQLSLEEVGAANVNGRHHRPGYTPSQPEPSNWQASEPPLINRSTRPGQAYEDEEDDPDLRAAIEASLREANAPKASAPIPVETPRSESQSFVYPQAHSYPTTSSVVAPAQPNYDLQPLESDVILTFSQTIQEIEARGGSDISRFPAVNELYDKANGLRPKLALSLDDTDRKQKLLMEMQEKLSEAVKLYDGLLTQQLSRPTWRTQTTQNLGRSNSTTGAYSQWTTGQSSSANPYATQTSYNPIQSAQGPVTSASYTPNSQAVYQNEIQSYTVPQQISSPPPVSQVYRNAASPPPVQVPIYQQQYIAPLPASIQTSPPIAASSPPAVPIPSSYPGSAGIPQQQTPQQQHYPPQPSPPVSRQNTISYASPPPTAPFSQQAQQQPSQYSNPQPVPTPAQVQVQMPHFPSVPTTIPQSITSYAPQSSNLGQAERKEAMLIDL